MDRKILINDLMVRREVLIPEDISRSGKVEFAHFRLDHIDAVLAERKDLIAEVERLQKQSDYYSDLLDATEQGRKTVTAERDRYKAALERIAKGAAVDVTCEDRLTWLEKVARDFVTAAQEALAEAVQG